MNGTNRVEFFWMLVVVVVAAFISFFISLQAGLAVLVFAVLGWWVWQNPEHGFLFFIITAPVLPLLKFTQTGGLFTLIKDVIIFVLLLRVFAWPLLQKKITYRRVFLFAPLVLLALWTAVAALRGDQQILSILRARDILLYPLLYFGVLYLPSSKQILKERYGWLMAVSGIVMLLAIYQWFFALDSAVLRFDPVRSIWIPRLSSTFGHPTVFGEYIVMLTLLCTSAAVYLNNTRWRWINAAVAVLTLPFIYLTYSRGVWLGLVAGLGAMACIYIWQWMRNKEIIPVSYIWKIISVSFVSLIILLFIAIRFTPVGTFLQSSFDPTYSSNSIRLEFVARLLGSMSNTDALFGQGLGDVTQQTLRTIEVDQFDIATGDDREVQLSKDSTLVDNQYLKTFVEMGLAGILIFAFIYWRFFQSGFQALTQPTPYGNILGLFGIGFLAAFLIQAFFVDIWDVFPTNALFWIVAALLSAANTRETI